MVDRVQQLAFQPRSDYAQSSRLKNRLGHVRATLRCPLAAIAPNRLLSVLRRTVISDPAAKIAVPFGAVIDESVTVPRSVLKTPQPSSSTSTLPRLRLAPSVSTRPSCASTCGCRVMSEIDEPGLPPSVKALPVDVER